MLMLSSPNNVSYSHCNKISLLCSIPGVLVQFFLYLFCYLHAFLHFQVAYLPCLTLFSLPLYEGASTGIMGWPILFNGPVPISVNISDTFELCYTFQMPLNSGDNIDILTFHKSLIHQTTNSSAKNKSSGQCYDVINIL